MHKLNKVRVWGLLGVFLLSFTFSVAQPSVAQAADADTKSPTEVTRALGYFYTMRRCIATALNEGKQDYSNDELNSFRFLNGYKLPLGTQFINKSTSAQGDWDGNVNCDGSGEYGGWRNDAIGALGYSNPRDMLCNIIHPYQSIAADETSVSRQAVEDGYKSCLNGQGNLNLSPLIRLSKFGDNNNNDDRSRAFNNSVGMEYFGWGNPLDRNGIALNLYLLYRSSFQQFCQPVSYNGADVGSDYEKVTIQEPDVASQSTKPVDLLVKKNRLDKRSDVIAHGVLPGTNSTMSCRDMINKINSTADAATTALMAMPPEEQKEAANDIQGGGVAADGNTKSSCGIDGVGWMVCPMLGFLGTISDQLFSFLASHFLAVDVDTVSTTKGTYEAWSIMRNIANVAFVIAFLIIIFSQMTSVGINNYGIKKMLPRLVVAAILVNISFIICQVAVDLSNILGYGLKELFGSVQSFITPDTELARGDATGNGFGIAIIMTAILAGGITLALAVSVPVILAVLIALLVIIFILLARKALIVLLIVIAPLAFVAYLLPNTEQWYKKWQKMFFALLLVFPIISVVFGASSLAAYIIKEGAVEGDNLTPLIAIGVAAIPLIIVPALLKGSIAAAGAIGTTMKGWGDKGTKRIGSNIGNTSRLGQYSKYRKNEAEKRRALIQAGGFSGTNKNPLNWGRNATSRFNKSVNASPYSGKFGNRNAAMGVALAEKIEDEEVSDAQKLMRAGVDPNEMITKASEGLAAAIDSGDVVKARAAQQILLNSGNKGLDTLHQTLSSKITNRSQKESVVARNLRSELNQAGLKGKNNALAAWSYNDLGTTLDQTRDDTGTLRGLSDTELAGQSFEEVLKHHRTSGVIDQTKAQSIIDNQNIWKDLSKEKQDLFVQLAGRGPAHPITSIPPPSPPTTPTTAPPSPPMPTESSSTAPRPETDPRYGRTDSGLYIPRDHE